MTQLNKEQQTAVRTKDGPVLVLAGPGSGKTAVLTEHIRFLITEARVDPSRILALTFSKKAAMEMQRRFLKNTEQLSTNVTFGTFHSVFLNVLKQYKTEKLHVITPGEQINLITDILRRKHIEADAVTLLNLVALYKNTGSVPLITSMTEEVFLTIFDEYGERMRKAGYLDFEDMIGQSLQLLKSNARVLRELRSRYEHILTDEFQDCNAMQYELLKLLSGPEGNLFVVGDDDQSIYAFRGAKGGVMQQFESDHPGAATVCLVRNYRCAESIIDTADRFVRRNRSRMYKPKQLASKLRTQGSVTLLKAKDAYEEAAAVREEIVHLTGLGMQMSDIAILYRSEQCADYLEEYLQEQGFPVSRQRKNTFYEMPGIREMLAYLAISQGETTRKNFYTILNRPQRDLVRECIGHEPVRKEEMLAYYAYDEKAAVKVTELFADLQYLKDLPSFAAIHYVFKKIGLGSAYDAWRIAGGKEELPDADTLTADACKRAAGYDSVRAFLDHAETVRMREAAPQTKKDAREGIVLQTVHASKGLEYDTVFVIGLQEGLFPSARAGTLDEIEEERRLFYVAMTRARERLYLCARGNEEIGKRYSSFIAELGPKIP